MRWFWASRPETFVTERVFALPCRADKREMTTANTKLIKHLEDAHAIELALVQTLTAHIGVTPAGEYRDLLERHLEETVDQSQRLRERLSELGAGADPIAFVRGVVTTLVGQAVAGAKAPLDLLRGPSGEEKLLRNARDEIASEALEIATYDAIEALADAAGDEKTAVLAREHRTQEEVMLRQLREVVPALARDAFAADVEGNRTYKASQTGAGQAATAATRAVRDAGGKLTGRVRGAAEDLTLSDSGSDSASADVPVEGFDRMGSTEALAALNGLDNEELGRIEAYERTTRNRKSVIDRIGRLRREAAGVA